ncbi:hypothetical protein ACFLU5_07355, partial [Bacteroidota bacterium]
MLHASDRSVLQKFLATTQETDEKKQSVKTGKKPDLKSPAKTTKVPSPESKTPVKTKDTVVPEKKVSSTKKADGTLVVLAGLFRSGFL